MIHEPDPSFIHPCNNNFVCGTTCCLINTGEESLIILSDKGNERTRDLNRWFQSQLFRKKRVNYWRMSRISVKRSQTNTKRGRKSMRKKVNGSNETLPSFVATFRSIDSHLAFNLSDFLAKQASRWKKYEEKKEKSERANEIRGSPGKLVATLFRFKLSRLRDICLLILTPWRGHAKHGAACNWWQSSISYFP